MNETNCRLTAPTLFFPQDSWHDYEWWLGAGAEEWVEILYNVRHIGGSLYLCLTFTILTGGVQKIRMGIGKWLENVTTMYGVYVCISHEFMLFLIWQQMANVFAIKNSTFIFLIDKKCYSQNKHLT